MSRWSTRLFRALAPIRLRQWMRKKWRVVANPRHWWDRVTDPFWRWTHGQARPWERAVGMFFWGMWDGVATVFERGDPRKDSYWKRMYGSLPSWEQTLVALVLGTWLVMAHPFRKTFSPQMPEFVNYPDPEVPGGGTGEEIPVSYYETELTEKADALASAIEDFCKEAPMMELARALECLSPAESRIGEAFANLAQRMRDEMPINEDFVEGVDLVSEGHHDLAKTCSELPDSFRISHDADVQRVENPRNGEELWNPEINRGY